MDIAKGLEMFLFKFNFQNRGSPFKVFDLHREEQEIRTLVYNLGYDLCILDSP
jgi:hypothetical protein